MNSILVIGGAHIDRKCLMSAPFIYGASIPGLMEESIGGGAFNVATNLSRLGNHVVFISPRAEDGDAKKIETNIRHITGFEDRPLRLPGGTTPGYTAMIDMNGELITALADMKLYDELSIEQVFLQNVTEQIKNCRILITDANLPECIIARIARYISSDALWFAIGISPAKVVRYRSVFNRVSLLAMNKNEAIALTGEDEIDKTITALKEQGLKGAIITDGADQIRCYYQGGKIIQLKPRIIDDIADVTGAGDAMLSGFITAILADKSLKSALEHGMIAAELTIAIKGAQNPQLSSNLIAARLDSCLYL